MKIEAIDNGAFIKNIIITGDKQIHIAYRKDKIDGYIYLYPLASMTIENEYGKMVGFCYPLSSIEASIQRQLFAIFNVEFKVKESGLFVRNTLASNYKEWVKVTIGKPDEIDIKE